MPEVMVEQPLILGALGAILAALIAGSVAAVWFPSIRARVVTWWCLAAVLASGLAAGPIGITVLFALISFLALREFLSLAPTRRADRPALLIAYAMVPLSYGLIAIGAYGIWLVALPVYGFLLMPAILLLNGRTNHYLSAAGTIHWGLMATTYTLGHAALLMYVPASEAPAGGPGLLLFLLVATALNDVFQFICGKLIGGPKIAPTISPGKTWAGFLGGCVLTGTLILLTGPLYTGLGWGPVVLLAALLPVAGFAGDLTMSAIKRDLGVKDSSNLLPGHGGVLDRVDSLAFTAPLTFHVFAFFASERF